MVISVTAPFGMVMVNLEASPKISFNNLSVPFVAPCEPLPSVKGLETLIFKLCFNPYSSFEGLVFLLLLTLNSREGGKIKDFQKVFSLFF